MPDSARTQDDQPPDSDVWLPLLRKRVLLTARNWPAARNRIHHEIGARSQIPNGNGVDTANRPFYEQLYAQRMDVSPWEHMPGS